MTVTATQMRPDHKAEYMFSACAEAWDGKGNILDGGVVVELDPGEHADGGEDAGQQAPEIRHSRWRVSTTCRGARCRKAAR